MPDTIQAIQHDIAETSSDMEATAAELRAAVSDRIHRAEERVDPRTYVRQFPWAALGLALGAGLAVGLTGADRKAVSAAADGAKHAGGAIAEGSVSAKDAIVERLHGGGAESAANEPAAAPSAPRSGVRGKLMTAVNDLLESGLQEVLTVLGPAAQRAPAQMSVGATGSSVPLSNDNSASDFNRVS